MGKIAVYGGTFNPPHLGHLAAAKASCEYFRPDRLLVIPTNLPPHKAMAENSASNDERMEMLRILFRDMPEAEICDMELTRGGVSYTADTLEELSGKYPEDEIILLMGTDMITDFEIWRRWQWILENYRIGAFPRRAGEEPEILKVSSDYRERFGARIELVPNVIVEVSSTELREKLKNRSARELVGDELYGYIIRNRLYGALPNYDWLREKAYELLKPRRVPHVRGCEEEAVKLAKRWGADIDDARTAAILHDCTKKCELDEQLLLCRKYGIITDNIEERDTKLLHAKTGAALAEREFGVSPAIRDAIKWHTTGRPGMTLLEKIIYMADYIEPTRDFEGLDELRRLAYEDLDSAMILGLKMSIDDLKRGGIMPHPRTAEAAKYLEDNSAPGIDPVI